MTPSEYGILMTATTLGAAPLAWTLARIGRWGAGLAGLLGLGLVSAGIVVRGRPDLLTQAGANEALAWLHGCLLPWGGLVLLGACIPFLRRRPETYIVAAISALASVTLGVFPLRLAMRAFSELQARPVVGVCVQSTPWSCGPAAAASLLATMGVKTDEAEMATRCATIPGRGTSDYGLWSGVRSSLNPYLYDVDLVRSDQTAIGELPTPAVLLVRPSLGDGHAVTLLRTTGRLVAVADPSRQGVFYMEREQLEGRWDGVAIVVRPIRRITSAGPAAAMSENASAFRPPLPG